MKNNYLIFPLLAILLLTESLCIAQNKKVLVTVSGHITDARSGETLIGAGVVSDGAGAVTNTYGFYTLSLERGKNVELRYSYVGYEDKAVNLDLQKDTTLNISLKAGSQLKESIVEARREAGVASTKMSAIELPMNVIQNTPTLFGEADVLKTIQLLPGVQSGTEGFSGIYVRGGGPDENLLLLDGVSLYNAEHMLGLFSIFQPESVKTVTLFKGSFPARYGGRISSIIDVRTNDGDLQETHGLVSVGLISDKFHLEGPIFRGKTSYSFSARGMHTVLFDRLIHKLGSPANYFFYDLNAKVSHRFSDRDRLFLNVYNGRDVFYYKDDGKNNDNSASDNSSSKSDTKTTISWGNSLEALRWNHVFNGRLFANTTLAFTNYKMKIRYSSIDSQKSAEASSIDKYVFDYRSGIKDITAKIDFDYTPSPRHLLKFGGEYVHHTYVPETYSSFERQSSNGKVIADSTVTNKGDGDRTGHEMSLFIEDDFSLADRITLNPGIRLALFLTNGRTYLSPEPRLSVKYDFGKGIAAKAAYSRMSQYAHLLSSARITLPTDLWVPITRNIKPVTSDQYSLGLYFDGLVGWEFSLEGYLKNMRNVLEYKDGVSFIANSQSWEESVVMGLGRAFGMELFIRKTMGKTTGWLGYTLAKSERRFPDGSINNGEWYPHRYDRRHNVSLVVNQRIGTKIDISGTWTFASGGATTIPEREVTVQRPDGTLTQVQYTPHRNNYRLPPSHRLNVGVNFHKKKRHGESIWNVGVYNIYNRMNPNFVFSDSEYDNVSGSRIYTRKDRLKSLTILPVIPSFSYTYKF